MVKQRMIWDLITGLLVSYLSLQAVAADKHHYVISPHPVKCHGYTSCLTLEECLKPSISCISSNAQILFLSGIHTVHSRTWVIAKTISNVSIIGDGTNVATILCRGMLSFIFIDAANVHISGIEFVACGLEIPHYVMKKITQKANPSLGPNAAISVVNVYSLVLDKITIRDSYGYGVLGVNVIGHSVINKCRFEMNNWRQMPNCTGNNVNARRALHCIGGNLKLGYTDHGHIPMNYPLYTMNIVESNFSHGFGGIEKHSISDQVFAGVGGLGIISLQPVTHFATMINISNSNFSNNFHHWGGNTYIVDNNSTLLHVSIHSCKFLLGGLESEKINSTQVVPSNRGGGLFIRIHEELYAIRHIHTPTWKYLFAVTGGTVVHIANSEFSRNWAQYGAGILAYVETNYLQFLRNTLVLQNCLFRDNWAYAVGSAIYVRYTYGRNKDPLVEEIISTNSSQILKIFNTVVMENKVNMTSTISVEMLTTGRELPKPLNPVTQEVIINNFSFVENEASVFASALEIVLSENSKDDYQQFEFKIQDCIFSGNRFVESSVTPPNGLGDIIHIQSASRVTLSGLLFEKNDLAACIWAYESEIWMSGKIEFIHNYSQEGTVRIRGKLQESLMYFAPNTNMSFFNNTTEENGGGISVRTTHNTELCFFQFPYWDGIGRVSDMNITLSMAHNHAGSAGDSIFTEHPFENCELLTTEGFVVQLTQDIISDFIRIQEPHSLSEITSEPYKLCYCFDGTPNCTIREQSISSIYPGQIFNVSAVSMGQFNGASPAVVAGNIDSKEGVSRSHQSLSRECGILNYSVFTEEQESLLEMFTGSMLSAVRFNYDHVTATDPLRRLTLHVHLQGCPQGFELQGSKPSCVCSRYLVKNEITICDISKLTFHRHARHWIGSVKENIAIHNYCPFDYCNSEDSDVQIAHQDEQCALGHGGILCGACRSGLSLALGTSVCKECSNRYLLLLIAFGLAGVALVFLLLKLNLTVAEGKLNALILYANVIQVNQTIFFPSEIRNISQQILSVFVAWINLDLGIEACFYNGMDAYGKTWLQFVFPAYIWILAGFIVTSSWYLSIAQRLVGTNGVHVLATLLLLAYAKLLRTVITIFSFTTLTDEQGNTSTVWLMDGNVEYFGLKHSILIIMAVVVLLIYIVPFTFLVVLAPCLQAQSHCSMLHWVNKLKPLLDAYQGPYKDKFRSWTGLMLLLRVLLFTIFAVNALGDPAVNLLAIGFAMVGLLTLCWHAGIAHKGTLASILQSFFIFNLGSLTVATNFVRSSPQYRITGQLVVTSVTVGSALVVFCIVVVYEIWRNCLKKVNADRWSSCHTKFIAHPTQTLNEIDTEAHVHADILHSLQPTRTVVELSQLREPLLSTDGH